MTPEPHAPLEDKAEESLLHEKENPAPLPPSPRRHSFLWKILLLLLLLFSAAALYLWNEGKTFLETPPETPGKNIIISIEPGMNPSQVAALLEEKRVITNAWKFQLLIRYEEKSRNIQAGRFLVSTGWLPKTVLDMLVSGKAMLYKLTLREGLAWWEVAELVEKNGFCKAADFTSVIHDQEFLHHWGIPFDSAEGFLFPETYLLPHPRELNREAAVSVADRLVEMFWRRGDKLWKDGKRPSSEELKRLVTLASIVEKETGVPEERSRVAGVYTNRLARNMLLQADPTVIYGLGRTFKGPLLRSHLDDAGNRYNTYQNAGLPPGPICSFGTDALKAAISPEQHDYLYFVATGKDKGHRFSKTLAEHNKAVRAYRTATRNSR